MRKASFFIDGFNLYHSLDNSNNLKKYKWLDLHSLCSSLLFPNETLNDVFYFTAYTDWNTARKQRHQDYVTVNINKGCKVILGKFIEKDRVSMVKCNTPCLTGITQHFCKKPYKAHEEKMTDVNIAVDIVKAAALQTCEAIYLVSGDNDLLPALKTVRKISPGIRLRVVLPINAQAKSLMDFCSANNFKYMRIKKHHLANAQFPDQVVIGNSTYTRPPHWI